MKIIKSIALTLCVCFVGTSYADSDGVFCVGKDYVAIDARGIFLKANKATVQIVTISAAGALDRHVVATPPNLNKRLRCEADKIVLSDGHFIDLTNINQPRFRQGAVDKNVQFSELQLPYIEQSKAVKIQTTDQSHYFTLILNYALDVPEEGLHLHHISAKVVKSAKSGDFVKSILLAEGIRLEAIH